MGVHYWEMNMHSYWVAINRPAVFLFFFFSVISIPRLLCIFHMQELCSQGSL